MENDSVNSPMKLDEDFLKMYLTCFFKQITNICPSASQEVIIHLHPRNQNNQQHTFHELGPNRCEIN